MHVLPDGLWQFALHPELSFDGLLDCADIYASVTN